jgi:hypothetical protein
LEKIQDLFGAALECPITAAALYQNSDDLSLSSNLSDIVTIDPSTSLITIKNNV